MNDTAPEDFAQDGAGGLDRHGAGGTVPRGRGADRVSWRMLLKRCDASCRGQPPEAQPRIRLGYP